MYEKDYILLKKKIDELEYLAIKLSKMKQREERLNKEINSISELWGHFKQPNVHVITVSQRE